MKTYKERSSNVFKNYQDKKAVKRRNKNIICLTCVLAFVTAFNLFMFVPYSVGGLNVAQYENSEYYSVIEKLSPLTHGTAYQTNNFKRVTNTLQSTIFKGGMADAPTYNAPADGNVPNAPSSGKYEEVTNTQTEGVIEGDLFKRSSEYVYYLDYAYDNGGYIYLLKVYSIQKENSALVAEYRVTPSENTTFNGYYDGRELFLSEDCQTVTVLSPTFDYDTQTLYTTLISIDVSDVENIQETNRVFISGSYVSSRIADDDFLLVSNFSVKRNADYSQECTFLPQAGAEGDMQTVPMENVVLPENPTSTTFTVITSLDAQTLAVGDSVALLSFSDEVYVSQNNIFVTRSFLKESLTQTHYITHRATEIRQIGYADGELTVHPSMEIKGFVNDRFSLDEHEGVLRVFSTANERQYTLSSVGDSIGTVVSNQEIHYSAHKYFDDSAYLTCIDLTSRQTIASVERFCPEGEQVMSARFMGDKAYVCTAKVFINYAQDPVYAFDLSDYNNITYVDTGTIPGYSLSLVSFTDGTLLGIGYGDNLSTLNVSIYQETQTSVEIATQFQASNASFSQEFKAYLIDKKNALIGLSVSHADVDDGQHFYGYLLFRYDGYNLTVAQKIPFSTTQHDYVRATVIDGYLYLFGNNLFEVVPV